VKPIRLSIKAIVLRDGQLLTVKNRDRLGDWHMLPGGGQEWGEPLDAALRRECIEEIGCAVKLGRLRFVRDYIAKHHEFAKTDGDVHQVELMFECNLESEPSMGTNPDSMQTGIEWLPLASLSTCRLYPAVLKDLLLRSDPGSGTLYLGDVN
jgi:ADP-ribose pyrophosphatase YjhB (NUDIX family)